MRKDVTLGFVVWIVGLLVVSLVGWLFAWLAGWLVVWLVSYYSFKKHFY
jgi:hypothetical protein